jgi:chaperonin cofactor prefoldin
MSDTPEPDDAEATNAARETDSAKPQDIRERIKQFAQPFVDSLDGRLRDQVDKRVDHRVDETLSARLSVIERAIADLDRSIKEIQERLDS